MYKLHATMIKILMYIFQFSSQVWRWAQEHNCFIHGQADSLQIGLHDGKMSLWLDDNIERGRSEVNSQWDSGKLPGPCASLIFKAAAMAEWLRRWTWNPMGSPRVGSNPADSVPFFNSLIRENVWNRFWCYLPSKLHKIRLGGEQHSRVSTHNPS